MIRQLSQGNASFRMNTNGRPSDVGTNLLYLRSNLMADFHGIGAASGKFAAGFKPNRGVYGSG